MYQRGVVWPPSSKRGGAICLLKGQLEHILTEHNGIYPNWAQWDMLGRLCNLCQYLPPCFLSSQPWNHDIKVTKNRFWMSSIFKRAEFEFVELGPQKGHKIFCVPIQHQKPLIFSFSSFSFCGACVWDERQLSLGHKSLCALIQPLWSLVSLVLVLVEPGSEMKGSNSVSIWALSWRAREPGTSSSNNCTWWRWPGEVVRWNACSTSIASVSASYATAVEEGNSRGIFFCPQLCIRKLFYPDLLEASNGQHYCAEIWEMSNGQHCCAEIWERVGLRMQVRVLDDIPKSPSTALTSPLMPILSMMSVILKILLCKWNGWNKLVE